MYMVHTNHSPAYISQALSTASRQSLRSANSTDYLIPRTRTKFGERTFSVSGPATWNNRPESLHAIFIQRQHFQISFKDLLFYSSV
jgi:hypothetical protein